MYPWLLPCFFLSSTPLLHAHLCLRRSFTDLNNKLTNTRHHNKYLLEYIGYMFRPVNRSSSGLQQNKSQVLFGYWDPNIQTAPETYFAGGLMMTC